MEQEVIVTGPSLMQVGSPSNGRMQAEKPSDGLMQAERPSGSRMQAERPGDGRMQAEGPSDSIPNLDELSKGFHSAGEINSQVVAWYKQMKELDKELEKLKKDLLKRKLRFGSRWKPEFLRTKPALANLRAQIQAKEKAMEKLLSTGGAMAEVYNNKLRFESVRKSKVKNQMTDLEEEMEVSARSDLVEAASTEDVGAADGVSMEEAAEAQATGATPLEVAGIRGPKPVVRLVKLEDVVSKPVGNELTVKVEAVQASVGPMDKGTDSPAKPLKTLEPIILVDDEMEVEVVEACIVISDVEDDKQTVGKAAVKTETVASQSKNPRPAVLTSKMVDVNVPSSEVVKQAKEKKTFEKVLPKSAAAAVIQVEEEAKASGLVFSKKIEEGGKKKEKLKNITIVSELSNGSGEKGGEDLQMVQDGGILGRYPVILGGSKKGMGLGFWRFFPKPEVVIFPAMTSLPVRKNSGM